MNIIIFDEDAAWYVIFNFICFDNMAIVSDTLIIDHVDTNLKVL